MNQSERIRHMSTKELALFGMQDIAYVKQAVGNGEPGYGYNPGCRRGIRIGSAKDGSVKYFVPDAAPSPAAADSTGPEGITADAGGDMYGAEFTMDVKKYARK